MNEDFSGLLKVQDIKIFSLNIMTPIQPTDDWQEKLCIEMQAIFFPEIYVFSEI